MILQSYFWLRHLSSPSKNVVTCIKDDRFGVETKKKGVKTQWQKSMFSQIINTCSAFFYIPDRPFNNFCEYSLHPQKAWIKQV